MKVNSAQDDVQRARVEILFKLVSGLQRRVAAEGDVTEILDVMDIFIRLMRKTQNEQKNSQ